MTDNEDPKCEAGCMTFYGGERRHHKDCFYYPDSLTRLYDEAVRKIKELELLLNSENTEQQTKGA